VGIMSHAVALYGLGGVTTTLRVALSFLIVYETLQRCYGGHHHQLLGSSTVACIARRRESRRVPVAVYGELHYIYLIIAYSIISNL